MIKEIDNALHIQLDRGTLDQIENGETSAFIGVVEFLWKNATSCDLDDVHDVTIVNDRFVLPDGAEEILAAGQVLIVPECDHIEDYADWWK